MTLNILRTVLARQVHGVRGRMLATTALLGVLLCEFAYGHHGFDGRYDLATPVWIEGIVVEAYFGNLQLEGLCMAIAAMNRALIAKGLLTQA